MGTADKKGSRKGREKDEDATTASFALAASDLEERSPFDKMVMRVTCELLAGFESCFWRAIRGRGLAYDFGL